MLRAPSASKRWRREPGAAEECCGSRKSIRQSSWRLPSHVRSYLGRHGGHDAALVGDQISPGGAIHLLECHGVFFVQDRVDQLWFVELDRVFADQLRGAQDGAPAVDKAT